MREGPLCQELSVEEKLNALEKVDNPSMGVLQVLGTVTGAELTTSQDVDMMRLSYVQEEVNERSTLRRWTMGLLITS